MRSLITKAEYLRETESWVRQQKREERLRLILYVLGLAALVAVLLGWPCTDAMCAPAG
jgi:type IV secretory pathway component VirB8